MFWNGSAFAWKLGLLPLGLLYLWDRVAGAGDADLAPVEPAPANPAEAPSRPTLVKS